MMMFNPVINNWEHNSNDHDNYTSSINTLEINNDVDNQNRNKKQKISMSYPSMDPNRMGSNL